MSSLTAFAAFQAWFDANWLGTARRYAAETYQPPAPALTGEPAPFVYLDTTGDLFWQMSIGAPGGNLQREEGRAIFEICVATGSGASLPRGYAFALGRLLKGLRLAPGIACREISLGIGGRFKHDGNYFAVPLVTRWQRDFKL